MLKMETWGQWVGPRPRNGRMEALDGTFLFCQWWRPIQVDGTRISRTKEAVLLSDVKWWDQLSIFSSFGGARLVAARHTFAFCGGRHKGDPLDAQSLRNAIRQEDERSNRAPSSADAAAMTSQLLTAPNLRTLHPVPNSWVPLQRSSSPPPNLVTYNFINHNQRPKSDELWTKDCRSFCKYPAADVLDMDAFKNIWRSL